MIVRGPVKERAKTGPVLGSPLWLLIGLTLDATVNVTVAVNIVY